jgi:hypothetical protein
MLCPQNRAARSNTRASALTAPRLVRLPPLLPLLMFPVQLIPEGGLPVYGDTPAPVMPTSKCYCVSMPTLSEPTFSDRGCASLWSRDARGAGVAPDDRGDGVASTFLLWSSSLTTFCLRPCFHARSASLRASLPVGNRSHGPGAGMQGIHRYGHGRHPSSLHGQRDAVPH